MRMGQNSLLVRTNVPGLYRNTRNGVVINRNIGDLNALMTEQARISEHREIKKTVDDLTNTVMELKKIITEMTGRNNAC